MSGKIKFTVLIIISLLGFSGIATATGRLAGPADTGSGPASTQTATSRGVSMSDAYDTAHGAWFEDHLAPVSGPAAGAAINQYGPANPGQPGHQPGEMPGTGSHMDDDMDDDAGQDQYGDDDYDDYYDDYDDDSSMGYGSSMSGSGGGGGSYETEEDAYPETGSGSYSPPTAPPASGGSMEHESEESHGTGGSGGGMGNSGSHMED